MSAWMRWLLGLQEMAPGAEGVAFGFEREFPAWAWAGAAIFAVAFAGWSYRKLTGPLWARGVLAGVRALLLMVVGVLAAGPRLVEREESVERDWVMALVDRSASMGIADSPGSAAGNVAGGSGGSSARMTRDVEALSAIARTGEMWEGLASERELVWMGFDAGAYDLKRDDEGKVVFGEALGRRTAVGLAVEQALRRAAARPLSAIVVFTDGRSVDEVGRSALRQLQAERVPVHVVALGSEEGVGDIGIARVEGPGVAYVHDVAPITVELERLGGNGGAARGATVRLVDGATGMTLEERRVEVGDRGVTVALGHREDREGKAVWRVEVAPDGADLIEGNNSAETTVEFVDRPMRVLYVDGYPRWEQRYLKNLLLREKTIVSSALLLAPNRRYLQEGDVEVDALPDSPERWAEYDVVAIGDVDPGVFTKTQLEQLREHVALRGGGLLWIGGAGSTPQKWFDTPLADVLPMTGAVGSGAWPVVSGLVMAEPTALSERLGVLRLGSDEESGWPREMLREDTGWNLLRWVQRIEREQMKPAAEALAVGAVVGGDEEWPVALTMRFGAGTVVYVATDETWRWRFGRGEAIPERFWVQTLRYLGRGTLGRAGKAAVVEVAPRRSVVEQAVRVSVELLDQRLIDAGYRSIALRLERRREAGEEDVGAVVELAARAEDVGDASGAARRFGAVWTPPEAGVWSVKVVEPGLSGLGLVGEAVVSLPDDELRHPETDHVMLARLAEETGGRVWRASEIGELADALPNREVRAVRERFETLWDTPGALLAVMALLTLEWVGRRVIRLI